ncbi:MAG: TatD family hydrolase [Clostridia bacterium]|nr:TatD family hydrolase [Clostridia bacterium]MBQ5792594.1 TatD family hydrolase [Clostridia bacterium]
MKLFDSHAHYFDKKFDTLEGGAHAILTSPEFRESVGWIINVGIEPASNLRCIEQTAQYDHMYCAIGIHPHDCQHLTDTPDNVLATLYSQVCDPEIRRRDKIVAIGEIGFDYYWQPVNRELQAQYFSRQLDMARELDLPVIIHDREAHGDTLAMIKQYPDVRGVFHSYSGSDEMAKELVKLGWYISFSGPITFKNADRARRAAAAVPLDRLLLETDCPYLTPHPHRGKVNHSGYMYLTAQMQAELHGVAVEEIAEITAKNAMELFKIL